MTDFPRQPNRSLITIRRGGLLTDQDHRLLATWALTCAEHVLFLFEQSAPSDYAPRAAIAIGRAWTRGEVRVEQSRRAASAANTAAAQGLPPAAHLAALSAGQAAAVPYRATYVLTAAAYAIRAVGTTGTPRTSTARATSEREWQHAQLPDPIKDLVLADQKERDHLSWNAFSN